MWLRKGLFTALMGIALWLHSCQSDPHTYAVIETDYGNIEVKLYNTTPKHRDNFIKLAREGFYDSLLFHRVIPEFMIQGGDPDSKHAAPGQVLGQGGPGYTLEPEIGAPHFRGALAAARLPDQVNPEKRSSGSQFYIVVGRKWTDAELDAIEQQNNITYNEVQRQMYKEKGGTPFLDGNYTVFGEVVKGMEVVDRIATAARDKANRPLQDIRIKQVRIK